MLTRVAASGTRRDSKTVETVLFTGQAICVTVAAARWWWHIWQCSTTSVHKLGLLGASHRRRYSSAANTEPRCDGAY